MSATAKLTVMQGSERGKVFVLNGELAHIGRSAENQVVLSDPGVAEHQACIANRNGRFAIYVAGESALQVNGQSLPPEQWIWLPPEASLQFTDQTSLKFQRTGGPDPAESAAPADLQSAPEPKLPAAGSKTRRKVAAKKTETSQRVVAKFITDRTGETLVRLGADGQLPELELSEEGRTTKAKTNPSAKGNPVLVYLALGGSVLLSALMLMLEPSGGTQSSKADARQTILREFMGQEGKPLKPFQQLLREGELAYSRNDRKEEREAYQSVLRLLNSEDRNPMTGVTGHIEDDERLKKLIAILLGAG